MSALAFAGLILIQSSLYLNSKIISSQLVPIDASIWLPATDIRWPGDEHAVYFTTDIRQVNRLLGASSRDVSAYTPQRVYMGNYNGYLVVFANQLKYPKLRIYQEFLAAHESFHIAAQYFGGSMDAEIIGTSMHLSDLSSGVKDFWRTVISQSTAKVDADECRALQLAYERLTPQQKLFVQVRSYWEWPAEYYSRTKILRHLSQKQYINFRNAIEGDNLPYIAGSTALIAVDRLVEKKTWQKRISNGEHPLNVYSTSYGCKPLFKSGLVLPVVDLKFGNS